jgi:HlyD family secretion protein
MANSKKRKKIIVFSIIGVVLVLLTLVAVFRKKEPAITIQTEKVARRNITEVVVANGKIQPVTQVVISPEVAGEIVALPVKEGNHVKKGDLLVQIKPDNYRATRNSAEAYYKSAIAGKSLAQAQLDQAQKEYKRNLELFQNKLVSDSVFLEFETAYEVAKLQYENATHQEDQARFQLDKANDDLAKTTIVSPIDGTIVRLKSQLGERVLGTSFNMGTEIMTVADLGEMEARVDLGEVDVVLISTGQIARLQVDAFKDRKFAGTVSEVANSAKGLGQSSMISSSSSQDATKFEVHIRVKEKEAFLPGMSVTAEIETRYRTNVLSVPIASVTTRIPKEPAKKDKDKKAAPAKPGQTNSATARTKAPKSGQTNTAAAKTNSPDPGPTNTAAARTDPARSNDTNAAIAQTDSPITDGTNSFKSDKKGKETKQVEVVFTVDGNHAKMVPVKIGISDDSYWEVTEGVAEGQEVVSGGYKAISRDLEDGKKVVKGTPAKDSEKKEP